MSFISATFSVKMRLERPAELVGAKPLHLLTQTALPLKSPTGAFIATLRFANAVAPNAKYKELFRYLCAERILNVFRQSVQRQCSGVVRNTQKLRGCLYFACGECTISTEYVCAEQESDRQSG